MDWHVYRTKQLKARGSTDWDIRKAAQRGDLNPLRPGWYAAAGADPTVVAAVRAGGVLSCVSALRMYGIWVAKNCCPGLHVRLSRHGETAGVRRCHPFGPVPPTDQPVDALPAAFACAYACMSTEEWIAAVDSALNRHLVTVDELLAAWPHVPSEVRRALDRTNGRAESGTETFARLRLQSLGFRVHCQVYIPKVGRVDLVIGRLIIECDSEGYHSSPRQRRNDYRRDRWSQIGGWLVIRIDFVDVLNHWPEILAEIRAITSVDRHRRRTRIAPR